MGFPVTVDAPIVILNHFDTDAAHGTLFGEVAAAAEVSGFAVWAAAGGVILAAIGAYKQYQMYEKMGNLATTQATAIADQQARTNRITDEYFIPQLKRARDYLWGYANTWGKNVQELVVECATRQCAYAPPRRTNAATVGQVAKAVGAARRVARRALGLRQVGVAEDQSFRLGAMQATLLLASAEIVTRFEDEKTLKWNQFYWGKMLAAAQIAQNALTLGSNMVVGASSGVNAILGNQNQLFHLQQQALELQFVGLSGQASVFGGLGSLGGLITGTVQGQSDAARLRGASTVSSVRGGQGYNSQGAKFPEAFTMPAPASGSIVGFPLEGQ